MAWSDSVDAYCERLAPGLAGEPLNALTNLAFLAAALALLRLHARMRRTGTRIPADVRALPWLIVGVACCSFLFHVLAVRWAAWLDSFSILLYCAVCIFSFLWHATSSGKLFALISAAAFALVSLGASRLAPPSTLNGSLAYMPNAVVLLAVSAYLAVRRAPAARGFVLASVVFAVALVLRTFDLVWCSKLPAGTHFIWHLLTGWLTWIVSKELTLRRYRTT